MEEKLLDIINQALQLKAEIIDEDYKIVTYEYFKQLPNIGDIIINDCERYEVIRREFETNSYSYSYDSFGNNSDCKIIVRKLTTSED